MIRKRRKGKLFFFWMGRHEGDRKIMLGVITVNGKEGGRRKSHPRRQGNRVGHKKENMNMNVR